MSRFANVDKCGQRPKRLFDHGENAAGDNRGDAILPSAETTENAHNYDVRPAEQRCQIDRWSRDGFAHGSPPHWRER